MDGEDSEGNAPSETLRTGSDNVVGGVSKLGTGVQQVGLSAWQWLDRHPIIKWVVSVAVGLVVSQAMLQAAGWLYAYFFGRMVPIGGDVSVTTTPLPLGLSVNVLFFLWVSTVWVATVRIVRLRQRVEQLEEED